MCWDQAWNMSKNRTFESEPLLRFCAWDTMSCKVVRFRSSNENFCYQFWLCQNFHIISLNWTQQTQLWAYIFLMKSFNCVLKSNTFSAFRWWKNFVCIFFFVNLNVLKKYMTILVARQQHAGYYWEQPCTTVQHQGLLMPQQFLF